MRQELCRRLLRTRWARNRLCDLSIYALSVILRLHLTSLSMLLIPEIESFYLLNTLQILLSVLMYGTTDFIWGGVAVYRRAILQKVVKPLTRATEDQLKLCQRLAVVALTAYLVLIFALVNITSSLLIIYSVQNCVILFLCDFITERCKEQVRDQQQPSQENEALPSQLQREVLRPRPRAKSKWLVKRVWRKYVLPRRI